MNNYIAEEYDRLHKMLESIHNSEREIKKDIWSLFEDMEYMFIEKTEMMYAVTREGYVISFVGEYPRILKPKWDDHGYAHYKIRINGILMEVLGHRLVAEAFIHKPTFKDKLIVNHIDENPSNNCADNLEWVTASENAKYGTANDRRKNTRIYNEKHDVKCVSIHPKAKAKHKQIEAVWLT